MKALDLRRPTVRSIIDRYKAASKASFISKPRSGRQKKTSNRDDRALLRAVNRDTKLLGRRGGEGLYLLSASPQAPSSTSSALNAT